MRRAFLTAAALTFTLALTAQTPKAQAVRCSDFATQAAAQAYYSRTGDGSLDRDRDGIACENLPAGSAGSTAPAAPAAAPVAPTNAVCRTEMRIRDYNGMVHPNENVNLRTGPSTTSRVIAVLPPETLVRIHSWRTMPDGRWAWVTTEQGRDGWAREPYVGCVEVFNS